MLYIVIDLNASWWNTSSWREKACSQARLRNKLDMSE